MAFTSIPVLWAFKGPTKKCLVAISYLVAHLSRAVDSWLLGMLPGTRACAHLETPRTMELQPNPCQHSSLPIFPSGSNEGDKRRSALSTLLSKLGTRVGSTRQPPLPPALPAPSLAGGRQLCGCSAHLPPPESRALKLPGCGQPCCHGNCILHPCRRLHLKAIGRTEEQGDGRERKLWPDYTAPPSLPSPPSS